MRYKKIYFCYYVVFFGEINCDIIMIEDNYVFDDRLKVYEVEQDISIRDNFVFDDRLEVYQVEQYFEEFSFIKNLFEYVV